MDGKMFILGLSLGMLGGAIIVSHSHKARKLVRDTEEQIRKKAEELKKCKCCDCEEEGDENS